MEFKYCKLEIFLPPTHLEVVQKALQEVDAGHIGNYDSCMSVSPVTGYWRPLDGCDPYIGTNGEISCEPELKVEVTVYTENDEKMSVGDVNIQFDKSTGKLSGTIVVNFYAMLGNGVAYKEPDTTGFAYGVNNVFGAVK